MALLTDIFAGTLLALIGPDGREVDDAGYGRQRLNFKIAEDRAELGEPVRFGPWRRGNDQVSAWVIYDANGEIVDCGPLLAPRWPLAGDEIVYPASSIRAAALGDLLGATFVFMPSGFVAVTPTGGVPSSLVGYAEPEELIRPFWLPKRRWAFMPENPWLDSLKGWRERLPAVDVGAREYLRSAVAEALLGIGALEL